ncbi:MAG: hypothetical protein AAF915_05830, partial [Cyanobacteria bacterium P01_D01_bin.50]
MLLVSAKGVGSFLSTSVNSGVAHPTHEKIVLKLLAIVHPLFSANLTNRGLPFDLFTGLLVLNRLWFSFPDFLSLGFR